jgi:ATP phosphoribosyltransferase regulatory subunit
VLPQEAAEREVLARTIAGVMQAWGYGLVETPVVEEYRTLEAGAGSSLESAAFRLFDRTGELLALRPEMTVPIARVVATRLKGEPGPHRLRYVADVFRDRASMRGEARQFTQAGLEFVGAGGPVADAEVVGVLVQSLAAVGLAEFTVGMGTVGVLRALIDVAGQEPGWGAEVLAAAHERNLVALDTLSQAADIPPQVGAALRELPRLRGGREAIDACREIAATAGAENVLDEFAEVWDVLESTGLASRVSVDFGIMRAFDYYSGLVLEVYAPGLGLPIGGGGRYDGVLAEFDAPTPAAGFAIGIERLHIALAEQGAEVPVARLDAVLGGESRAAFAAAGRLRAAGWRVRLADTEKGGRVVAEADAFGAHEALLAEADGTIARLDRAGCVALPLEVPLPAPPSASWAAGEADDVRG